MPRRPKPARRCRGLRVESRRGRAAGGGVAYINFAGGAGGDPQRVPGRSCDLDQLTAVYTALGRTTTLPNVWIYAANDQCWGPDAPKVWHAGFAAGGSPTRFVQTPPVADGDGHGLSRHAPALWAGYLDEFLLSIVSPRSGGAAPAAASGR